MPDYAIVNKLCDTLGITVSELLDGEENECENLRMCDNDQMIEMIARIQRLESQRVTVIVIAPTVMGIGRIDLSPRAVLRGALFSVVIGTILISFFPITHSVFAYLSQSD